MWHESVHVLEGVQGPLVALLSRPCTAPRLAVLMCAGAPQYRVGSHRQFTLLARTLARAGIAVLRLDVRGRGDSAGQACDFDAYADDLRVAATALPRLLPGLEGIVLWGLCDGASALALAAATLPGTLGIVLVNPWVRSPANVAQTQLQHYYRHRWRDPAVWRALPGWCLRPGRLWQRWQEWQRCRMQAKQAPAPAEDLPEQIAGALHAAGVPCLFLLSEHDLTAAEARTLFAERPSWQALARRPDCQRQDLAGAHHTFASAALRARVAQNTLAWLEQQIAHGPLAVAPYNGEPHSCSPS